MDDSAGRSLRIYQFQSLVSALGPGRRFGLWVQGCSIHCHGCMSRDTWDPGGGSSVRVVDLCMHLAESAAGIDGVTVTGGEPFDQPDALGELLRRLREETLRADQDVLVYSGYPLRTILHRWRDHLAYVDALVSEPYRRLPTGQPALRWRGSANQRLTTFSDLGLRRYAGAATESSHGELQVMVQQHSIRIVGVPYPGDLERLASQLADKGVVLEGATWS